MVKFIEQIIEIMEKKIKTTLPESLHGDASCARSSAMSNLIILTITLLLIIPACTRKDATVWVASPWQRVLRSTPPGELMEVKLKAAANEYEPFRLIIHYEISPLKDVNVTVSNLKSRNGEIASDNIHLYRANYLNITKPSNRTKNPIGWYPDALIPFKDLQTGNTDENITYSAAPFSVDTAQNAEVWCDLFVPSGTKPGIYLGKATIISGKRKLSEVPIELEVWDFELPEKISMLSHFGSFNKESAKMMGIEPESEEFIAMEALYCNELLKH